MWVGIVVAGIFLFLVGRSLGDAMGTTASRPVAFMGAAADGLAMVAMAVGVFGLLMALVLGVFADHGPRLAGASLRDTLLWSGGMIVLALALLLLGSAVRRAGSRAAPAARRARRAAH
jgi:hypothetical protein